MTNFPISPEDEKVQFKLDANALTDDEYQELLDLLGGDSDALESILDDYR